MLACFSLGAFWDGLTTAIGIAAIIGATDLIGYFWCLVGAVVILGLGIGTRLIFSKNEMPFPLLKGLWYLAFVFDVFTPFAGNFQYIILKKPAAGLVDAVYQLSFPQLCVAFGLTVLVSASPIVISYIWNQAEVKPST
jgi:hypothetical protein